MTLTKRILLGIVLLDFAALTVWAFVSEPLSAAFATLPAHPWALQTSVDLVIALTFGAVWLHRDARSRGANPWPWILALPLGSLSLLAYLLVRPERSAPPAASLAAASTLARAAR